MQIMFHEDSHPLVPTSISQQRYGHMGTAERHPWPVTDTIAGSDYIAIMMSHIIKLISISIWAIPWIIVILYIGKQDVTLGFVSCSAIIIFKVLTLRLWAFKIMGKVCMLSVLIMLAYRGG